MYLSAQIFAAECRCLASQCRLSLFDADDDGADADEAKDTVRKF